MFDELRVLVNDSRQWETRKSVSRYVLCFDGIHLSYGLNRIRVAGFKKGKQAGEIVFTVYFRSDISAEANEAPGGYKQYLFHTAINEKSCASCHQLDFRRMSEMQQEDGPSPCYQCHKKMLSEYTMAHGPAAVWSCAICHDVRSSDPKLAVATPSSRICVDCHETNWGTFKYMHGPTAAGSCTLCHNPHASNIRHFLRTGTVNLCSSCHEDVLRTPHVLVSFSGIGGHPVSNRLDPSRTGAYLTCASCHNPHGGNSATFLNNYDESKSIKVFCRTCH
jgi:predicted CXXCH cytochrome family protein